MTFYQNIQFFKNLIQKFKKNKIITALDEKFPPSIADAKNHGLAKRVGTWPDLS